jgi:hypothetical protein
VSSLIERMYPLPDYRRTPLSLLRWWESRRLFYNRIVGTVGVVSATGMVGLALLPPHASTFSLLPVLVGIGVYGVLANFCYSLGWVVEVVARALWGREAPDLGPVLFRQGLIFSVGLTLFPLFLSVLLWVARVVVAVVG